jgi:hypothetical protein
MMPSIGFLSDGLSMAFSIETSCLLLINLEFFSVLVSTNVLKLSLYSIRTDDLPQADERNKMLLLSTEPKLLDLWKI